jgi:hypothetical protein
MRCCQRLTVVYLGRNYDTQLSEGEFGVNDSAVDEMLDFEEGCPYQKFHPILGEVGINMSNCDYSGSDLRS